MGQIAYYHNLTKGWFNENDFGDAAEQSDKGDDIKFSVRGNAQMFDLKTLEPEDAKDYEFVKEQFTEHFKEDNNVDFY